MALGAGKIAKIEQELASFDDVSQVFATEIPASGLDPLRLVRPTETPSCSIRQFDLHLLDSADL